MLDTGDFYGDGANKERLSPPLTPHRDPTVPAAKTGVRRIAGVWSRPVRPTICGVPAKRRCAGCALATSTCTTSPASAR
jgi:hypothetical protein